MQVQLAVALSALFHIPTGRDSRGELSGMIQLKIGGQAAKSEIEYLESEPRCVSMHRDEAFDSSETRKICENWWGYRRKRRAMLIPRGSLEDPVAISETPGEPESRRTALR